MTKGERSGARDATPPRASLDDVLAEIRALRAALRLLAERLDRRCAGEVATGLEHRGG